MHTTALPPGPSAGFDLGGSEDSLAMMRDCFARFDDLIDDRSLGGLSEDQRWAGTIGRPTGSPEFLARREPAMRRSLRRKPRGPKPASGSDARSMHGQRNAPVTRRGEAAGSRADDGEGGVAPFGFVLSPPHGWAL